MNLIKVILDAVSLDAAKFHKPGLGSARDKEPSATDAIAAFIGTDPVEHERLQQAWKEKTGYQFNPKQFGFKATAARSDPETSSLHVVSMRGGTRPEIGIFIRPRKVSTLRSAKVKTLPGKALEQDNG